MPNYIGGHCTECGAVMHPAQTAKHNEWHEKMDELIEWAQAVSATFGGQSETPSS